VIGCIFSANDKWGDNPPVHSINGLGQMPLMGRRFASSYRVQVPERPGGRYAQRNLSMRLEQTAPLRDAFLTRTRYGFEMT
jgi:hypothetical protein